VALGPRFDFNFAFRLLVINQSYTHFIMSAQYSARYSSPRKSPKKFTFTDVGPCGNCGLDSDLKQPVYMGNEGLPYCSTCTAKIKQNYIDFCKLMRVDPLPDILTVINEVYDDIDEEGAVPDVYDIQSTSPAKVAPTVDLTTQGIEPNPGPKTKRARNTPRKPRQTSKMNIGRGVKASSTKVKGRGGFFEDAGSSIGSKLGKLAGSGLASIFGMGAYSVSNNSLLNANNPPVLMNSTSGTIIRHREYVADILSSTGFTVASYPINVGISTTFPWLAGIAQSFEQYRLRGLIFEYKSLSGRALNSVDTALGTVIMATEYDATKPAFTDKRSMENYTYSTSCDPGVDAMHPIECAVDVSPLGVLYTRNSGITASTDLRFSDLGLFQVATVGMQQAGFIAGELWATYEVELLKPRLPPTISSNPPMHYSFDSVLFVSSAGAPTSANLFGTAIQKLFLRGVSASVVNLSTNSVNFTATGTYVIVLTLFGGSVTIGNLRPTISSGSALGTGVEIASFFAMGGSLGAYNQTPATGSTSGSVSAFYAINVTTATPNMPCQVVFPAVTIPSSVTSADLLVAPLPQGFTLEREFVERDELYRMVESLLVSQRNSVLVCDESDEKFSVSAA